MIEELINTALIGTDKKPLNVGAFPEAIQHALTQLEIMDEEEKFLKLSALMLLYEDNGHIPPQYKDLKIDFFKEKRKYTESNFENILLHIAGIEHNLIREQILSKWLDKIMLKDETVSKKSIMTLLKLGAGFRKENKKVILEVIGQRASVLAKKIPDYQGMFQSQITSYSEASNAERLIMIKEKGNILLDEIKNEWDAENIAFKKNVLDELSKHVNTYILDFMQSKLETEFKFYSKEKKTERECRTIITKTLLLHNHKKLRDALLEKLKKYVVEGRSGLMGLVGEKSKSIELPSQPDEFFNAKNMDETFALDIKNPDPALFVTDVLYWFSQLASYISMKEWNELLGKNTKATFEYFGSNEKYLAKIEGKKVPIFERMLSDIALHHPDQEFIFLLMKYNFVHVDHYLDFISHLNKMELLKFIKSEDLFLNHNYLPYWQKEYGDWDFDFSKSLLNKLYKNIIKENQYLNESFVSQASKYLHLQTQSHLEEQSKDLPANNWGEYYNNKVIKPLTQALSIRKEINQY
ncbi:MAG: hypothetical protein RLZZ546_59 [Bacteroidota bacterium]|jgi:hypothetical protein